MVDYSDFLDRLRSEVDIISLVSDYVHLRRSGKNYIGLCPFHQEKTPSFTVSPERRMFYCFGCHAGGDAITFLMKIENLTFPEAVEALARRLGLKVPQKTGSDQERKDKYYRVNELACSFFENCLNGPEGMKVRDYLIQRGIKEETWRIFRLGYAPESGPFLQFMQKQGIDPSLLLQVGLIRDKVGGKELFRNRLMFPIMDLRGRVIAFGGRALDDSQPKYLNTGQTPIFEKGRHLYALHLAKRPITEVGNAIVVEGYLDAIACHQFGFHNAVASLGTALTREQVGLLARFSKKVILAYDADLAGVMATLRSLELFGQMEMEVRVANLGGFKDPDELLHQKKAEGFSRAILSSVPALDFAYEKIRQKYDWKVSQEKKEAVLELLSLISSIDSPLDQEKYIKRLALDSGFGEDTLFSQLRKLKKSSGKAVSDRSPTGLDELEGIKAKPPAAEVTFLKIIFKNPELIALVEQELDPEDFSHPYLKKIFQESLFRFKNGQIDIYNITFDEPEASAFLARLLLESLPETEEPGKELKKCLLKIKKERLTREYKRLSEEISILERSGDLELYRKKLEELQLIVNKIRSLTVK
ncbi:MAG: DNA primase [bacterium]